jgi:hypothetical protein
MIESPPVLLPLRMFIAGNVQSGVVIGAVFSKSDAYVAIWHPS